MWNTILNFLENRRQRVFLYGAIALALFLAAIAFVKLKGDLNFVVSDGRGYYVYLPSVVIDGDLDFSNQIREHWDVDFNPALLEDTTPLGFVRNKYPTGLALSLLPAFTLAHGVASAAHSLTGAEVFAPNGYSPLYQLATVAMIMLYGLFMIILLDALLAHYFLVKGPMVALAVSLFWVGSHYAYYYFREPMMVHVVSAFWITACISAGVRATQVQARSRFVGALWLMCFAFAMAVVARPTNMFMAPFVALAGITALKNNWSQRVLWQSIGLGVLAAWPIAVQMTAWKIMTGSWISYSYKSEGFIFWQSPYLWSTLFSSLHGLFFWSPLLLIAAAGLALKVYKDGLRGNLILGPLLLGAAALWFFNSSGHQWWFGDAFGARSFLELAPLFVFGLAFFFEAVARKTRPFQFATAAFVGVATLYTYALMALYIARKIPRADYLF